MSNGKRAIGVFLLLAVFLGTTGVTFYHHVCACKPIATLTPVTHSCCGHSQDGAGCGMEQHAKQAPFQGCANHHKGCKDVPTYVKASLTGLPAIKQQLVKVDFSVIALTYPPVPVEKTSDGKTGFVTRAEDPPPIPGIQFLVSVHQLKIPFIG